MNLYQVPACLLKEALNLHLNNDAQISQLWKENLSGKYSGYLCMHSIISQVLIK